MGRMAVGRFNTRAEALDYLVTKYSTKDVPARYVLKEETNGVSRVTFSFLRKFEKTEGEVQYVGNGSDLNGAIADLFKHLDESLDAKKGA